MKTLLTAMALACFLHVVMNSRLTTPNMSADLDDVAQEDKELEKALHEILYQEDDQDLQVRFPSRGVFCFRSVTKSILTPWQQEGTNQGEKLGCRQ